MKKDLVQKFCLYSLLLLGYLTSSLSHAAEEKPRYREGQLIVKYKEGIMRTRSAMNSIYSDLGVLDIKRFSGSLKPFEQLSFDSKHLSVEQAIARISQDPSVEYAQPNYMLYALPTNLAEAQTLAEPCTILGIYPLGCANSTVAGNPSTSRPAIAPEPKEVLPPIADPSLSQAWGISQVSADQAWTIEKGSKKIIVAVIDTGIDYNHRDIAFNMWRNPHAEEQVSTGVDPAGDKISGDIVGWDFVHNDNLPYDDNQHGTHCAGVIGAVGGNGIGISGVNQRVSLMAVKFLSGSGSGDTATAIRAIDYAVSRGAKILSNSWGGSEDSSAKNSALQDAILRAQKAGVLFVAAAGNDGTDNDTTPTYPASFNTDNMISVAATGEGDGLSYFSNTGAKSVHIGAPGENIYSTTPNNSYRRLDGTSMACPHVAGAAALLWAHFPNASYADIKQRLMKFGDPTDSLNGKTVSGNRLNVLKALQGKL